jgi:probable HAF family extracellular repeat protein
MKPKKQSTLHVEPLEDRCVPALYAVTSLGTLGGYSASAADVNKAGQVVGNADTADGLNHAFLWDKGTMVDLGTLGGQYSSADAINDLGQVVGTSNLPGDTSGHAFLITPKDGVWFQDSDLDGRNDLMIDLGTLNGSANSVAADINNAGQVVGGSDDRAFIWDANSGMTELALPESFTYGTAAHINGAGQVTVYGYDAGTAHSAAFIWDATNGMTALGTGSDYTDAYAVAINDSGKVAGYQWNSTTHPGSAFLWTPDSSNGLTGNYADLGVLPNNVNSYAIGINNSGQVVGYGYSVESVYVYDPDSDSYYEQDYYVSHTFTWDATNGMVGLQDQLLPESGVTLEYASAINDDGAIAANGQGSAYLLTPIPPGTPLVGIADAAAVTEGNTGTVAATFAVTLSEASDQTVTVHYTTVDGSAAAGSDYQTKSDTLTFAPGETTQTITVLVNGDRLAEANETFSVQLSSPTNAVITHSQGTGTILDDEPSLSITPSVSGIEGNTGQKPFTFTVTLSSAYDAPVTVDWKTADGSATAGSDYKAASGTLTIPTGKTTGTITVMVNGDRLPESQETFSVVLSNPTSASISSGVSVGTIIDDEPRISINDVSKAEGKNKQTTQFTFTVTLSAAYDQAVTVSYRTTAGTAKAGEDYIAASGTITFAPGETTKTITIQVKGDNKREADETFFLDLFGNSSNSLFTRSRGTGTILNDD